MSNTAQHANEFVDRHFARLEKKSHPARLQQRPSKLVTAQPPDGAQRVLAAGVSNGQTQFGDAIKNKSDRQRSAGVAADSPCSNMFCGRDRHPCKQGRAFATRAAQGPDGTQCCVVFKLFATRY